MTIPNSTYPIILDTDENLFLVSDGLRVQLAEDYLPGDKFITIFGNEDTIRSFDETGIITLTEQCSEPELRAISFYYSARTLTTFEGLELLPGFVDVIKAKNITNVTQNVVSLHHNNLKNALIRIESFAGKKGEIGTVPMVGTMEQRINLLRKIVLVPRAWFKADKQVGLAPLTVSFTDQSFRLGTDGTSLDIERLWNFGDNTSSNISYISHISISNVVVPSSISNIEVDSICAISTPCIIEKTYSKPGIYDVSLKVTNDFGSDTVVFPKMINVRYPAPEYALIEPEQGASYQVVTPATDINNPYKGNDPSPPNTPTIRSKNNTLIIVKIKDEITRSGIKGSYTDSKGENRSYSGEVVDTTGSPIDPIISYTWSFSDDLNHFNSKSTKALFGVGGYYDLILRTDTSFGSYRITNHINFFDIVENVNLWLWNFNETQETAYTFEFGLMSETFKLKSSPHYLTLNINDSFLDGSQNETQQKKEFIKNNGAAKRGSPSSGEGGSALLYWASGRSEEDTASDEVISLCEYNGFTDIYTSPAVNSISRPWNWVGLASDDNIYFILGGVTSGALPNLSPTNQVKSIYNLSALTSTSTNLSNLNYKNGSDDLQSNTVSFDINGDPEQGHMSVYRSAWHQDTGYILRNDGVDTFFRIKSFYKTLGTVSEPFINLTKLTDITGPSRVEGELVSLSQGLYFFNNSGSISAYSEVSGTWTTGGPGSTSSSFRSLQDTTIIGFDDSSQTLMATSDGDKIAYLSFDYRTSEKKGGSFIKFNEIDTTFSSVSTRPSGYQWQMKIF